MKIVLHESLSAGRAPNPNKAKIMVLKTKLKVELTRHKAAVKAIHEKLKALGSKVVSNPTPPPKHRKRKEGERTPPANPNRARRASPGVRSRFAGSDGLKD